MPRPILYSIFVSLFLFNFVSADTVLKPTFLCKIITTIAPSYKKCYEEDVRMPEVNTSSENKDYFSPQQTTQEVITQTPTQAPLNTSLLQSFSDELTRLKSQISLLQLNSGEITYLQGPQGEKGKDGVTTIITKVEYQQSNPAIQQAFPITTQFTGANASFNNNIFTDLSSSGVATLNAANITTANVTNLNTTNITGATGTLTRLNVFADGNTPAESLSTTDYIKLASQSGAPGFAIISASNLSSERAVFKGTRSRGTLAAPTAPSSSDLVLSFLGAIYDGVTTQGTAMVNFNVDGNVSAGVAPQRIGFFTSQTDANSRIERFTIKADGAIGVGTTSPLAKMSIQGSSSTLPILSLTQSASQTANPFELKNSSGTVLSVIDSQGWLGIGTSTPSRTFSVTGNGYLTGGLAVGSTANNTTAGNIQVASSGNNPRIYIQNDGAAAMHSATSTINANQMGYIGTSVSRGGLKVFGIGSGVSEGYGVDIIGYVGGGTVDSPVRFVAGQVTSGTGALANRTGKLFTFRNSDDTLVMNIQSQGVRIGNHSAAPGTEQPLTFLDIRASSSATTINSAQTSAFFANIDTTLNNFATIDFGSTRANATINTYGRIGYQIVDRTNASEDSDFVIANLVNNTITERMRITSTGNVGIGTSSPTTLLNLSASDGGTTITNASAAKLDITNRSTTDNNFSDLTFSTADTAGATVVTSKLVGVNTSHTSGATSGDLSFLTRNAGTISEKMRLLASGNLGIGISNPTATLGITGTKTATPNGSGTIFGVIGGTFTDNSTAAAGTFSTYANSAFGSMTLAATNANVTTTNVSNVVIAGPLAAGANQSITNSYGLNISTRAVGASTTNAFAMIAAAPTGATNNYAAGFSGSVVISKNSSNFSGTSLLNFYASSPIQFDATTNNSPILSYSAGLNENTATTTLAAVNIYNLGGGIAYSQTNSYTTTEGSVLRVGTIRPSTNTNFTNLSAIYVPGGAISPINGGVAENTYGIKIIPFSGGTVANYGASVGGRIVFSSGLTVSAGTPGTLCYDTTTFEVTRNNASSCTVSSARFKHDIQDLSYADGKSGLEKLLEIKPRQFIYNNASSTARIGFIAEEVAQVDPRLVFYEEDGTTVRGVRYEEVTSLLAKAVQDLNYKLEAINASSSATNYTDGNNNFNLNNRMIINVKSISSSNGSWSIDENGIIRARVMCLEDVCLDKNELYQLKEIIRANGGPSDQNASNSNTSNGTSTTTESTPETPTEENLETEDNTSDVPENVPDEPIVAPESAPEEPVENTEI